jgi:hypothetical protein
LCFLEIAPVISLSGGVARPFRRCIHRAPQRTKSGAALFVSVLPFVNVTLVGHREGQGADMKQRLWFSLALIVVLFCFWLVLTKPMCRDGFAASLGTRSGWTCVADGN